ncbi:MAG TPA: Ku protein [Thermoanaerobaculia bacterium]|nr:Ku protein [Thermoanaerobaculia bacterium]
MSARPIAAGTISFGLVSIPVKLYAAADASAAVSFNMLHAKDGARLKQQYTCTKDGEIVPRDQMVKGYEFSKDRYVTFTPEELKALEEQSTQSIEVVEFVPISKVDPVYFDRTYYVGPDKGGAKAYALLSKVMEETQRVALARYAARGKMYLVMLRPVDGGIAMQQLYYADEVRPFSEVPVEPADVSDKELDLAKLLVDQRAANAFKPESYDDDVKKRVLGLIQKKVEGQDISIAPPETGGGQIIDLMEALKASLAKKPEAAAPAKKVAAGRGGNGADAEAERKPARRAPERSAAGRAATARKG